MRLLTAFKLLTQSDKIYIHGDRPYIIIGSTAFTVLP